ncbi:MAG TPA: hypothetical protein PLV25_00225, partial [Opitutales bacterium]|nr:hypothetical protein [Opitutales bacterium]
MKFRISLVVLSCVLSVVTGLLLSQRIGLLSGPNTDTTTQGHKTPLIGLSLDTLKEERWQRDRDLFVAKVRALGGEVLVQAANSDDARQIQDVGALISRGVDVLVIEHLSVVALGLL